MSFGATGCYATTVDAASTIFFLYFRALSSWRPDPCACFCANSHGRWDASTDIRGSDESTKPMRLE
jgi:hypothetical protein